MNPNQNNLPARDEPGGAEKIVTWKTLGGILCLSPALAAADTAVHGLSIAIFALFIIALSECVLKFKSKSLPESANLPFLLIIAVLFSVLTALLAEAYLPALYRGVGAYLSFLALYCVFLMTAFPGWGFPESGRDLLNLALGFVLLPGLCGLCREFLGSGTLFGFEILSSDLQPLAVFHSAPGAFLIPGLLLMVFNAWNHESHNDSGDSPENTGNPARKEA